MILCTVMLLLCGLIVMYCVLCVAGFVGSGVSVLCLCLIVVYYMMCSCCVL